MIGALRKVIKRMHYPLEVMLSCVRWYVVYPLSLRHIEDDHATVHRQAMKIVPMLTKLFRHRQRPVGTTGAWGETIGFYEGGAVAQAPAPERTDFSTPNGRPARRIAAAVPPPRCIKVCLYCPCVFRMQLNEPF